MPASSFSSGLIAAKRTLFAAAVAAGLCFAPVNSADARLPADGFVELAEQLTSVAVTISTAATVSSPKRKAPELEPGNPFGEFFKDFFDRGPDGGPRRTESQGSGFVIDAKGYIVTNHHVIKGADNIVVEFSDGRTYDAELKGSDALTDIALLKITPDRKLSVAQFGDSEKVRVGELVLAIGNPLGQGFSVSAGIISALNRNINSGPYDRYLQTDAAINQGNSGGPLINMKGEVIGVNTAIISPTGGSIGIGFSVPSNLVSKVVEKLRDSGEVRRGWLGVKIQPVDEAIASSLGLDRAYGALVSQVEKDSPSQKGGLKDGDVITRFNGREIGEMRQLQDFAADAPPGKKVPVEVFRGGKYRTFQIVLGLLDESRLTGAKKDAPEKDEKPKDLVDLPDLGLGFAPLDDAARKRYGVDPSIQGVLIATVDETSAAYEKGLRPGNVLLEVQQDPVKTPDEAIKRIEESRAGDRSAVLLMVAQGANRRFVAVEFKR